MDLILVKTWNWTRSSTRKVSNGKTELLFQSSKIMFPGFFSGTPETYVPITSHQNFLNYLVNRKRPAYSGINCNLPKKQRTPRKRARNDAKLISKSYFYDWSKENKTTTASSDTKSRKKSTQPFTCWYTNAQENKNTTTGKDISVKHQSTMHPNLDRLSYSFD